MAKRVITVTYPDGTKKVLVSKESNGQSIKTIVNENTDRRPKPVTPKISISKERNGYRHGGKLKFKAC